MIRSHLLRCARQAELAATYASCTASHANVRPEKAADWKALTRAALTEALASLDAVEPARLSLAARSEARRAAA